MKKLTVNMVSESEISVQGHGVHTAYVELSQALKNRPDINLVTGQFGKTIPCDIVHLHTIGARVWRKLFQKGPKKVISAHVVPDSLVGSLLLARYWRFIATWYMRWFYNQADLVLAVSPETARVLQDMGVKKPIKVITNSINTANYESVKSTDKKKLRQKLGIDEKAFVVISAGQIQPRKRVDEFVKIAKQLPDIEFVWVGGIPFGAVAESHKKMQKIMQNHPPNVHFTDTVPLDDMPKYYQMADVFWLPSEQETFGLVVVEAAATGLPIVLRDIADYQNTFAEHALLTNSKNIKNSLLKLKTDRKFYQHYQKEATKIANKFDSSHNIEDLVNTYKDLINS